jgi:hypothetical protein
LPISLDHENAKLLLEESWKSKHSAKENRSEIFDAICDIISASDVTFKYILITGVLANCTDERIHPRALQAGSTLEGAYDARSLCHSVVVPFEKKFGNLWGLSNEPFLNKPARHPEHSKDNPLRNKKLATNLHLTLDSVRAMDREDKLNTLKLILKLSSQRMESRPKPVFQTSTNFQSAERFLTEIVKESSEGCSLVALIGNFFREFSPAPFEVKIHPTTNSDAYSRTAGDIEIFRDGKIVAAIECKERRLTKEDVSHGILKAGQHAVQEYWFITSTGVLDSDAADIRNLIIDNSNCHDLYVFELQEIVSVFTALLNPIRRGTIGPNLASILTEDMNRSTFASKVVEIWNRQMQE